jgi:MYXO-CTERM domain-containing protein
MIATGMMALMASAALAAPRTPNPPELRVDAPFKEGDITDWESDFGEEFEEEMREFEQEMAEWEREMQAFDADHASAWGSDLRQTGRTVLGLGLLGLGALLMTRRKAEPAPEV